MKTMNNLVNKMFMSIVTVGTFTFAFTACSDDDVLNDKNPVANDKQSTPKELLEPLALNFFDYNNPNDVQIMNADTTMISVSNGDRIELKVVKVGIGEFLVGKSIGLDTRMYVNENANVTRGANGDLSSRYTDAENFIHPLGVRVIYRDCEPNGLTRGMDSYESEYFTAEELLGMDDTRGLWSWIKEKVSDVKDAVSSAWRGHYFTIDKNGNIINIETEIKADPKFGSEGDTLNVHIKAPAALNLNYKFYLDVDRDYAVVPILNKFDAGVDGRFTFKPQITIGFDKKKKLAEVKKEIWNFTAFSFTFAIGPVPFWVDVNPSMYMKFDADVKGSFYGGVKYEYDRTFKGGVRYQKEWQAYGETEEVTNKLTFITPTTSFKAEAGIGLFLGVDLIIDKVAGPEIAIGPKLSAEAELKIAPIEDKPIKFNAEVKAGVYADMGAKLKLWKFDIADWNTSIKLVPEKTLWEYEYPKDEKSDDPVAKVLDKASEAIVSARNTTKDALLGNK